MNLRSIVVPACLALFACSSETTVTGSGGASSGGVSGGGGSPTGGGSGGVGATGGTAGSAPTGGGTAGSGGTPTGGTGGAGTGGTGGVDCDAGPVPCGAEIVAQGVTSPYGLVLRGTDVYFTSSSAVMRCAKTGCVGTPTTVAGNQASARDLALRSGSTDVLFWTNKVAGTGSLMRCALNASCVPQPVMTGLNSPDHLAVSPSHAFFSEAASTLRRCDDTLNQTCPPILQPTADVAGLVFAQGRLYWSVPTQNKIDACLATNCGEPSTQILFPAGPNVNAMATSPDGNNLFWVHNLDPSPLKRCPSTGCPGSPPGDPQLILQAAAAFPTSIATDGSDVYMLQSNGAVVRCGVSACPSPTTHFGPFGSGGKIAVDGTHVYWTVPDKGYVLRKSKL